MRTFPELLSTIGRFLRDRSGNYGITFAAAAPVLMLAVGYGLNIAQLHTVKSNLLNALDSAVTSTARDLTTGVIAEGDARETVEAFLFANGGATFASADRVSLGDITINRATSVVSASASVNVDVLFPLFGAANEQTVAVESAARYSDKDIEVAMMLDVTGSMSGHKIRDLKTAARSAVDSFLRGQDPDRARVRVSIVPYADAVNTGSLAHTVYVEDGYTTGEPPALDDPRQAANGKRPDNCATERKGTYQFSDASPYAAMVNRDYRLEFCPRAALMPLTADADALKATIDSFDADGFTAGHIGIQWSWYMLSPQWRRVLPKSAEPARHDPDRVAKYAILMTDGEFNTAFAGVGRRGDTRGGQSSRSRRAAERLCDEMKKDGIEVFTVGFMLNRFNAKAVMRDCASEDTGWVKHYYEAADGQALDDAFQEIARNIEKLAVIK